MPTFLTVKEAAALTGRSPSSIRRIIYPITKDDTHADRSHVQPSPEEAKALRLNGENFAWRISEELLRREMPAEAPAEKGSAPTSRSSASAENELLAMLRQELAIKNQQITQQAEQLSKQMEVISNLGERLREGNILIATLQRQLALPEKRDATPATPVKTKREARSSPSVEKGSTIPAKPGKAKRGFLSRLFRKRP